MVPTATDKTQSVYESEWKTTLLLLTCSITSRHSESESAQMETTMSQSCYCVWGERSACHTESVCVVCLSVTRWQPKFRFWVWLYKRTGPRKLHITQCFYLGVVDQHVSVFMDGYHGEITSRRHPKEYALHNLLGFFFLNSYMIY